MPAALASAAAIGLTILLLQLGRVFGPAPQLDTDVMPLAEGSLTVVIPASIEAAKQVCLSISRVSQRRSDDAT